MKNSLKILLSIIILSATATQLHSSYTTWINLVPYCTKPRPQFLFSLDYRNDNEWYWGSLSMVLKTRKPLKKSSQGYFAQHLAHQALKQLVKHFDPQLTFEIINTASHITRTVYFFEIPYCPSLTLADCLLPTIPVTCGRMCILPQKIHGFAWIDGVSLLYALYMSKDPTLILLTNNITCKNGYLGKKVVLNNYIVEELRQTSALRFIYDTVFLLYNNQDQ